MLRVLVLASGIILLGAGVAAGSAVGWAATAPHRRAGEVKITGTVKSSTGIVLPGVSVMLQGMSIGAQTDQRGRYALIVPAAHVHRQTATLLARLAGYAPLTRSVTLAPDTTITMNFTLAPQPVTLSEMVVTTPQATGAAGALQASAAGGRTKSASAVSPIAPAPMSALDESDIASADELVVVEQRTQTKGMANLPTRQLALKREPWNDVKDGERADRPDVAEASLGPAPTSGVLRGRNAAGEIVGEFPLRHTDVNAEISGYLARTVVEQQYVNPYQQVIEAVYVFPLPSLAAVNDFVMEVGGRKIIGVVRSRAEAERIYQEARARGQTASLLTQERPNLFTQNVANIEPGGRVTIRITYFERLAYERGEYEWVFPMVVGPRYIPGNAQPNVTLASGGQPPAPPDGGGWSPNTDVVPDASRITPPVLKPGTRSGHDISLAVTLDAGLPITKVSSVAHQVEIERPAATKEIIRLAHGDSIPNRDFVLRWSVAGAETQFGVLAHRDRHGGYLTLAMQPPLRPRDTQVTPREITFIMDVSGSMFGQPIEMAKDVVTRTLDELRPEDAFNIVYFASGNAQLWEAPRPRSAENVAAAKAFLQNLSAGGGTEMLAGVERALHARHDPKYLQMYVFLTDGYVGDEDRILGVIKNERGSARFFGFGIGSAVNRYLIDGIGEHGGGESFVVIPRDSTYTDRAVSQLFAAIDSPVLVDVAIDWNGLPVTDVYPGQLRDLFAGQTINVIARYTKSARGTLYVTGRVGTKQLRYPVSVTLPDSEPAHAALAPTWARFKIADLSSAMIRLADSTRRAALEREITDLAIEYRLVSPYTAFVAVDESRIVGDGRPLHIMQPVELPEGVSWKGIFGEQPVGLPVRIGAWGLDVQSTQTGKLRVGDVRPGGAAAAAGISRGAVVRSVNGAAVSSAAELEQLLLQSGRTVKVELDPGGTRELPAP